MKRSRVRFHAKNARRMRRRTHRISASHLPSTRMPSRATQHKQVFRFLLRFRNRSRLEQETKQDAFFFFGNVAQRSKEATRLEFPALPKTMRRTSSPSSNLRYLSFSLSLTKTIFVLRLRTKERRVERCPFACARSGALRSNVALGNVGRNRNVTR